MIHSDQEPVDFTVHCRMGKRWVPHFLSMLNAMQSLGVVGSSRKVSLYADGDGDFRPTFDYAADLLPEPVAPQAGANGDLLFDAG